jgi:uncharacterized membrane protein YkoI
MKRRIFGKKLFLLCAAGVLAAIFVFQASALAENKEGEKKREEPVKSSIKIPSKAKRLVDSAKVSLADAVNIALKDTKGKAFSAKIEDEDGFLVFSVKISTDEDTVVEVKVDPGSGAVLKKEIEDKDDGNEGEDGEHRDNREDK